MGIALKRAIGSRYISTGGVISIFVSLVLLLPSAALATVTFEFNNITNNLFVDAQTGEDQLFMDVDSGLETVTFTFRNEGPKDSVIAEIYFDNGSLLGISTILDSPPDVVFEIGATPHNLPGGNEIDPSFEASEGFQAEGGSPSPMLGVGPGQSVEIMFDLINGGTLADVIGELQDGTLRVGIHVIDFAGEGSESFVNVPEPATFILLGLGTIALVRRRRRN